MEKDQKQDISLGLFGTGPLETGKYVNGRFHSRLRNRDCPCCQEENSPEEEYHIYKLDDSYEGELLELVEGQAHVSLRDGFRLNSEIDERFASDYTGSSETWTQISQWLRRCHDDHADCPKLTTEGAHIQYPTRLLDLKPLENLHSCIRLIISKEAHPRGQYMTLSHCWGKQPIARLTSHNLNRVLKKIEFDTLSPTFQDAVIICRKIGIRYLWIDSLCIIQEGPDSMDDWHRESAKMDEVYRNSFLNIGATGAADGRDGCFRKRDYLEVFRPVISKPECMTHYQHFHQQYRLIEESFIDDYLLNEPLLQRGWVFQERFLAPRMLHFGSQQLFWECKETQACESFPAYLRAPLQTINLSLLKSHEGQALEDKIIPFLGHYLWYGIVAEYTSKALTRPEDKFVAVSGVARQYYQMKLQQEDEYWAGTWKSDFPCGLCWTVDNGPGIRPNIWRAPSWSWASIEGCICAPSRRGFNGGDQDRLLAIMKDPHIELVSESNPFGAISAAAWLVQTQLMSIQAVKKDTIVNGKNQWSLEYMGETIETSEWYPDESIDEPVVTVLCLCLCGGKDGMQGLTVARVDGVPDECIRTGVFIIWPEVKEANRAANEEEGEKNDESQDTRFHPPKPFTELWTPDVDGQAMYLGTQEQFWLI